MPTKLPPKPYKTVQQQLDTYKQRGLIVDDNKKALGYLRTIGYYRLSGYAYVFRQVMPDGTVDNAFEPNSHFQDIKALYMFDKKLRQLAWRIWKRGAYGDSDFKIFGSLEIDSPKTCYSHNGQELGELLGLII